MNFKSYFKLDPKLLYLNSGSFSITTQNAFAAVQRYQQECELNPTAFLYWVWPRLWEVQKDLAIFFKSPATELFLRDNVTQAMNAFLLGMPMAAGGEIVVTDLEYGAIVNICRLRAEREGRSVRTIKLPSTAGEMPGLTKEKIVEGIVKQLTPSTRLLLVSHVATANGLVLPLKELAKETKQRGILLAVDGAHGPGSVPLDFSQLNDVDFYGGNLHKWMMASKGTGFGWLPSRYHEKLNLIEGGWTSFEKIPSFSGFGDGNTFALRMLKSSSYNFAPYLSLSETLKFWREVGFEQIINRLHELQRYTEDKVKKTLAWPLCTPAAGDLRGPLLTYELPEHLAKLERGFMEKLFHEHNLIIGNNYFNGKWHLRFSPHIYNDENEIDAALRILEKYK